MILGPKILNFSMLAHVLPGGGPLGGDPYPPRATRGNTCASMENLRIVSDQLLQQLLLLLLLPLLTLLLLQVLVLVLHYCSWLPGGALLLSRLVCIWNWCAVSRCVIGLCIVWCVLGW